VEFKRISNIRKQFFRERHVFQVFSGSTIRQVAAIVQGFVIARYLGASAFGELSLSLSFVSLVFGIADFKIAEAAIKFLTESIEKNETDRTCVLTTFFLICEILKALIAIGIIGGFGLFIERAFYSSNSNFYIVSIIIAVGLAFVSINPTLTAFLRIGGYFNVIALYDTIYGLLSLVIFAITAIHFSTVKSIAICYIMTGLIGGVVKISICVLKFKNSLNLLVIRSALRNYRNVDIAWRGILFFTFGTSLSATLRYIGRNIDVLILGKFVTPDVVGNYSLARKISNLICLFTDPLPVVLYPEIARHWATQNIKQIKQIFIKYSIGALSMTALIFMTLGLTSPYFVPIFLGKEYSDVSFLLWIIAPGTTIASGLFLMYYVLLAMGKISIVINASIIQFGVLLILSIALVPLTKEIGSAISLTMAIVGSHLFLLTYVLRALSNPRIKIQRPDAIPQ